MAFNLFDFSNINPAAKATGQFMSWLQQPTGWGMLPPTKIQQPLPQTPTIKQTPVAPIQNKPSIPSFVPTASADEIDDYFSSQNKSWAGSIQQTPVAPQQDRTVWQTLWEIWYGALEQAPSVLGNIGSFVASAATQLLPIDDSLLWLLWNYMENKWLPTPSSYIKWQGEDLSNQLKSAGTNQLGMPEDSAPRQLGRFAAEVIPALIPTWEAEIPEAVTKWGQLLKSAIEWGIAWAKTSIATKWKIEPADVALWAWANAILWLGSLLKKTVSPKEITTVASQILQPTEKEVASGMFDGATNGLQEVTKWMQKAPKNFDELIGTVKAQNATKNNAITAIGNQITDANGNLSTFHMPEATKILGALNSELEWNQFQTELKDRVQTLLDKSKETWLTWNEWLEVKRLGNDFFKWWNPLNGTTKTGITPEWFRDSYSKVKTQLEDIAKQKGIGDVSSINNSWSNWIDLQNMLQNQKNTVVSQLGRRETPTVIGKAVDTVMNNDVVKAISKPWQEVIKKLFTWNMNAPLSAVDVEAKLPSLISKLQKLWESPENVSAVTKLVKSMAKTARKIAVPSIVANNQ